MSAKKVANATLMENNEVSMVYDETAEQSMSVKTACMHIGVKSLFIFVLFVV